MERAGTGRRDAALGFLAALVLYGYTLAPGLQWGDSAALALQVHESALHLRSAGDHPLYVLLGMASSFLPGEVAYNLNQLSAVSGALAVALVLRIASRLAGVRSAGFFAAAALAVSHAFWLHAVIAEVYTLNALFAVLLVWLLLEWRDKGRGGARLALVGLVFLIGLSNHLVLAGMLPAILVFVVATKPPVIRRWRPWLLAAGVTFVAAWLLLDSDTPLSRILYGPPAITQYFRLSADLPGLGREALFYVLYLCYEFPAAGLLLAAWGYFRLMRRDPWAAALLGLSIVVNAGVFINNTEWPSPGSAKYVFYIQDYAIVAILLGYGVADLGQRWTSTRHSTAFAPIVAAVVALVPIVLYRLAPIVVERSGTNLLKARHLPYRDAATYFLTPSKRGDNSARQFGETVFGTLEPGAGLVADYTPYSVLEYLQKAEKVRPDVLLLAPDSPWGPIDLAPLVARHAGRPIYLAGLEARYYNTNTLRDRFDIVPIGILYRLRERSPQ